MTVTAPAPNGPRPGSAYFAPAVRLAKLSARLQPSGEAGELLPPDVHADVIRAEVTLSNTGLATYAVTLNNAWLSTARDRAGDDPTGGAAGPIDSRETLDPQRRPFWPRFKYDDFGVLRFGDRLRVDFRYWPDRAASAAPVTADPQRWVPMVAGPITDMRFTFAAGQGAQVVISGEDDLNTLKDRSERRIELDRLSETSMVRRVLQRASYPITSPAEPTVAHPSFATDDGNGLNDAVQKGQSYLEFIQKLAERLDYEICLEFSTLDRTDGPVVLRFEPYRGRANPLEAQDVVFRLDREQSIIEFAPTLKVVDQYTAAEVRGRHRDPHTPREVRGVALGAIVRDELHVDPAIDGTLTPGPLVREHFLPGRQNRAGPPNVSNLDDTRATTYAEALLRKKARELLTIDATAIGLPRLRPGRHVEIRGFRPPFNGFYYVTRTVHTFGADGLRTRFSASRPGLELPPYREGASGS